jgi:putative ABC transport system permease protein
MIFFALKMLFGDKAKFAGLLFGFCFTSFLVTFAASYFTGLMTRGYALISDNPTADVWVMDAAVQSVEQTTNLPSSALNRVRGIDGVATAVPLTIGSADMRFRDGRFIPVQVIGVDDALLVGLPPLTNGLSSDVLRQPEAGVVDAGGTSGKLEISSNLVPLPWSKPDLDAPTRPLAAGDEVTVNEARVRIVGQSNGAPRFPPQPLLFTTYSNAQRILPPERRRLTFVLVTASPGVDARTLAARIEATTDFRARTAADFKRDTVLWLLETSEDVGDVMTMLVIALLVGVCVSGVMMYLFTSDNLRHYAVLSTMGTTSGTLLLLVFFQAGACAAIGSGLGIGCCVAAGHIFEGFDFPFRLLWFAPVVGITSVALVSVIAAVLSLRQVARLEPAAFLAAR